MSAVISCFDFTTNMVKPWADAGFLCYCVDMKHKKGETHEGNIIRVGTDMLEWIPPTDISIAFFFPPCTDVAVSGARWFKDKGLGALISALQLFKVCVDIGEECGVPYMIENPVSMVATYWRKPDFVFHPFEYGGYLHGEGNGYTKKTCLWVGNGFRIPTPKPIPINKPGLIWRIPPSEERADLRAVTPQGFAQAIFEANYPYIARKDN